LVPGWQRFLGLTGLMRAAPDSILTAANDDKVCPVYCRQREEKTQRPSAALDNDLFYWQSLHIGLLGAVRATKSHWIFSASRRLASFGLQVVDAQTNRRVEDMWGRVYKNRSPLDRTPPQLADEIVTPLLFHASWDGGDSRMVLGLTDVDGEACQVYGRATANAYCRYIRASQGLVFLVNPFQIERVRAAFGEALPPRERADDPDFVMVSQEEPIKRVRDVLARQGFAGKIRVPIAVVVSMADELMKRETLLRESLWEYPVYHPGGKSPAYDMDLHWRTQFAVRDFLCRNIEGLVNRIEDNFENFAYFCVAPVGSSARKVAGYTRFDRFAPWRVAEPLLWLFWKLGLIPAL
jgi:hypothetical protein